MIKIREILSIRSKMKNVQQFTNQDFTSLLKQNYFFYDENECFFDVCLVNDQVISSLLQM